MENPIAITTLNDFIFCPASIYFHGLFGDSEKITYQSEYQLNGTAAHKAVDSGGYSSYKNILQGLAVYSAEYGLYGKIDIYNTRTNVLTERKKKIVKIYDGYVFQLYAQYFALKEMGFAVKKIELYSMDDNKKYPIEHPESSAEMYNKFLAVLRNIREFDLSAFVQDNTQKCMKCIYRTMCDRTLYLG